MQVAVCGLEYQDSSTARGRGFALRHGVRLAVKPTAPPVQRYLRLFPKVYSGRGLRPAGQLTCRVNAYNAGSLPCFCRFDVAMRRMELAAVVQTGGVAFFCRLLWPSMKIWLVDCGRKM
jgi:hypothetical protein